MTHISITRPEATALLEKSGSNGQYLPLSFGPGGLWLDSEDAGARWAIDALNTMRAAERELATELNRAVETAVNDTVNEVLNDNPVFEPLGTQDAVSRATDALTAPVTTAVFEAMQAAGFTIIRKA